MIPLFLARKGEKVKVVGIAGGEGMVRRLAEMGLYPGVEIEIISNGQRGPTIVGICEAKVGLGHGMAGRIFVEPL